MKTWLKNNIGGIILGAVIVAIIAAIAWPKQIAKLANGEQVAAGTKIKQYSADFLYNSLKEKYGLTILLSNLDKDLINDKYGTSLDDEAREDAKVQAETYIQQYKLYYQMEEDEFLSQNGFKTKDDFIEELMITYKINKYVEEYVSSTLTENDLNTYYDSNVFGKKKIYLISSASDESKVKAAQKEVKNGTSIDKIKSKYTTLSVNDLEISYDTASVVSSTVLDSFKNLKAKTVSEVIKDDTYGNVFVYVEKTEDKPSYESIKDSLKSTIATNKISEDQSLYYKALKQLRSDYGIKFSDDEYSKYYDNFNKQHDA